MGKENEYDFKSSSSTKCTKPRATIGIAPVSDFIRPIVGVPDDGNMMPHSYLFLPPQNKWPDLFVRRMKELSEKTQQQHET